MDWKRLLAYLGLNALVSAAVTLGVLFAWDATHSKPDSVTPTAPPTNAISAPPASPAASATAARPTTYVVQFGDTLGSIAIVFDVSVEDLMQANGLTDPNVLSIGQVLQIPSGDSPPAEPTATPAPPALTPLPTLTRATNSAAPQLVVRGVDAPGDLASEAVQILNLGGDVDLLGWSLTSDAGIAYRFPSLTLHEGGLVSVHTRAGTDTVTDLYWGRDAPAWSRGATVRLIEPGGAVHATFVVP